jgi:hypothetical protein
LRRSFHGVREHLIFTPDGRLAFMVQIPGRRHDVQGLYALLKTSFQGHLIGDNAYWPQEQMDHWLARKNIFVTADTRRGFTFQYPPEIRAELRRERSHIERFIGLFDKQFHADKTLNRSAHHYDARRWTKALSHNLSRHLNENLNQPVESVAHIRVAA